MMKRALGRGLGALLPPPAEPAGGTRLLELPVEALSPNPHQPRKGFSSEALDELASSIQSSGILQPLVARRNGERYEILVGERRWRAAQRAGLARVPVLLRDATDAEALELALAENLLREDLNPLEEADAYQRLMAEFGWTQEGLAGRLGRDRSSVANALRLRRLPEIIQDDLRAGRLTMGHARALLGLATPAAQLLLRKQILAQDWSVRATEAGVRQARRGRPRARRRAPEIEAMEETLRQALGVRVRVAGTLQRGRVELPFTSSGELEHLHALLTRPHPGRPAAADWPAPGADRSTY